MNNRHPVVLVTLLIVMTTPQTALADAIIPYLVVPMGQVFLFPLVVLLESLVLSCMIQGTWRRAVWHSFLINLASTLAGAALYFATMAVIGERIFNAWWKSGVEHQKMAAIVIALVFALALFGISWLIETVLLWRLRPTTDRRQAASACGVANGLTYAILLGLNAWMA